MSNHAKDAAEKVTPIIEEYDHEDFLSDDEKFEREDKITTIIQAAIEADRKERFKNLNDKALEDWDSLIADERNEVIAGLIEQNIKTLQSANTELKERNKELQAEIDDSNESFKMIMDEKCSVDERHCTCVPFLRERITELEKLLRQERNCLLDDLDFIDQGKSELLLRPSVLEERCKKIDEALTPDTANQKEE